MNRILLAAISVFGLAGLAGLAAAQEAPTLHGNYSVAVLQSQSPVSPDETVYDGSSLGFGGAGEAHTLISTRGHDTVAVDGDVRSGK